MPSPRAPRAVRLDQCIRRMADLTWSWGYDRITTPLAEPEDAFAAVAAEDLEHRAYRMIDASGRTMLLRSDVTLFAARQLAAVPADSDAAPTRAWYAEPILRRADSESLAGDEAYQLGVELIGDPDLDADLEVILLAAEYLASLGLRETVIHVGSAGLLADLPAVLQEPVRRAVLQRDWEAVRTMLTDGGLNPASTNRFRRISDAGSASAIGWFREQAAAAGESLHGVLEELARVLSVCADLSPVPVRLDSSELGSRSYHSGISFRIYGPGNSQAIGGGGRYNGLLGLFGSDRVATGWSMTAGQLLQAGAPVRAASGQPAPKDGAVDDPYGASELPGTDRSADFPERYRRAGEARSAGRRVRL